MKIRANIEVKVYELFMHDKYSTEAFEECYVAAKLTEELRNFLDTTKYWDLRIVAPSDSGLDRFIVVVNPDYEEDCVRYTERCYNKKELKKMLPKEIFEAIGKLEDESLDLNKVEECFI